MKMQLLVLLRARRRHRRHLRLVFFAWMRTRHYKRICKLKWGKRHIQQLYIFFFRMDHLYSARAIGFVISFVFLPRSLFSSFFFSSFFFCNVFHSGNLSRFVSLFFSLHSVGFVRYHFPFECSSCNTNIYYGTIRCGAPSGRKPVNL